MTIKCPKCGELAASEDKFCGACGVEISEMVTELNEKITYYRKYVNDMSIFKASDVTKEKLVEIFTNAVLEVTDDDDELYIKGGDFPLWVSIDEESKFIKFRTYLQCKDGAPLAELTEFSSQCNEYILVNFTSTVYEDGRGYLNGYYYMFYNFGLIAAQLVYTTKRFSEIFLAAIKEYDSEDKFFL
jgi:hypothetical protein